MSLYFSQICRAELMDTVTCLSGLYLGAVSFELRTNEHNGVFHRTEQLAHMVTVVQGTRGQDGHSRCEKFLSESQDKGGGIKNIACVCMCLSVCFLYLIFLPPVAPLH